MAAFSHIVPNVSSVSSTFIDELASSLQIEAETPEKKASKCFKAVYQQYKNEALEIIEGRQDDISKLGEKQDDISKLRNKYGRSLLQEALYRREIEFANILITQQIAIHERDIHNNSVIHDLARLFNETHLLDNPKFSYRVMDMNEMKQTPLHLAAEKGHVRIMERLIEGSANLRAEATFEINGMLYEKLTPLAIAAIRGQGTAIRILLNVMKNDPSCVSQLTYGETGSIIHLLIEFNHIALLRDLLGVYSGLLLPYIKRTEATDVVYTNGRGMTPFHFAAYLGNIDALRLLKEWETDLEEKGTDLKNAFHFAVLGKQMDAIYELTRLGCRDIQELDAFGKTPLMHAKEYTDSLGLSIANVIESLIRSGLKRQNAEPSYIAFPPENLVFKGGGPKGIGFIGAIKELERLEKLSGVRRVAGTSAGAITATLLAVGFTGEEIYDALTTTNLKTFLDHSLTWSGLTVFARKNILRFLRPFSAVVDLFQAIKNTTGLCPGTVFLDWIEKKVASKTGIDHCTFGELKKLVEEKHLNSNGQPFRHLHVFATSLKEEMPQCFSSENELYSDIVIADAIRASMSIPAVFKPHTLRAKSSDKQLYKRKDLGTFVDGGLINNFPIEAFDQKRYQTSTLLTAREGQSKITNNRTLGFSLVSSQESLKLGEEKVFSDIFDVLTAVMKVYFNAEENIRKMDPNYLRRVIEIDNVGAGTLEFDMPVEKQRALIESGRQATRTFFSTQTLGQSVSKSVLPGTGIVQLKPEHPFFVGRKELLEAMEILLPKADRAPADSLPTAILTGRPGVGKSEVAAAFANAHSRAYPTIGWIYASTKQSQYESYINLCSQLLIDTSPEDSLDDIVNRVHDYLENAHPQPYLLVFDDAERDLPLPKKGPGSIIVTTRDNSAYTGSYRTEILPLSEEEAIALLDKAFQGEKLAEKRQIAENLGGNPLELYLAAKYFTSICFEESSLRAFIETIQRGELPSTIVLRQLREQSRSALGGTGLISPNYSTSSSSSSIASSSSANFSSSPIFSWLVACSYFQPDNIPKSWLESWLTVNGYPASECAGISRLLLNTGLLSFNDQSKSYYISNSSQQIIRSQSESTGDELSAILKFLVSQPKNGLWYSHAETVMGRIRFERDLSWGEINFELGKQILRQKDPIRAQVFLDDALTIFSDIHHSGNNRYNSQLTFIHLSLCRMGLSLKRTQERIVIENNALRESAEIAVRAARTEPLRIAPRRQVAAASEKVERASIAARTATETALRHLNEGYRLIQAADRGKELDPDDLVELLIETGSLFQNFRNHVSATQSFESALTILENKYGTTEHLRLGHCLIKLGIARIAQKDYENAGENFSRALAMWQRLQNNANTSEIRICHSGLGEALYHLGEYQRAEEQFDTVLRKWTNVSPIEITTKDRIAIVNLHVKIAKTLAILEKYSEARDHFASAKEIAETIENRTLINTVRDEERNTLRPSGSCVIL